jgi:hypothetical protein
MPGPNGDKIQELYDEASAGVGAETLLKTMEPLLERRMEVIINKLCSASPELSTLLDLRAQLAEVWRMRRELKAMASRGATAVDTLTRLMTARSLQTSDEDKEA